MAAGVPAAAPGPLTADEQPLVAPPTFCHLGFTLPRQGRPQRGRTNATRETEVDINYLLLRQQTEKSCAEAATTEEARRIHEQLANQYERLIEQATNGRISFVRPYSMTAAVARPGRPA
jgi:hypothetical protein